MAERLANRFELGTDMREETSDGGNNLGTLDNFLVNVSLPETAMDAVLSLSEASNPVYEGGQAPTNDLLRNMVNEAARKTADISIPGWDSSIHAEFKKAIYLYTMEKPFNLYDFCNAALNSKRNGDRTPQYLERYMPYFKLLMTACQSLPEQLHYTGTAWRVLRVRGNRKETVDLFANFRERFALGKTVTCGAFTSMTKNSKVLDKLSNGSTRTIRFKSRAVRGYDISSLSAFPREEEVLVLPPASFEVESAEQHNANTVAVQLRQVDCEWSYLEQLRVFCNCLDREDCVWGMSACVCLGVLVMCCLGVPRLERKF